MAGPKSGATSSVSLPDGLSTRVLGKVGKYWDKKDMITILNHFHITIGRWDRKVELLTKLFEFEQSGVITFRGKNEILRDSKNGVSKPSQPDSAVPTGTEVPSDLVSGRLKNGLSKTFQSNSSQLAGTENVNDLVSGRLKNVVSTTSQSNSSVPAGTENLDDLVSGRLKNDVSTTSQSGSSSPAGTEVPSDIVSGHSTRNEAALEISRTQSEDKPTESSTIPKKATCVVNRDYSITEMEDLDRYYEGRQNFSEPGEQCVVCFEDPDGRIAYRCDPCESIVCPPCFTKYLTIQAELKFSWEMDAPCCSARLRHTKIQEWIPTTLLERYEIINLDRTLTGVRDFFRCRNPKCTAGQIHEGGSEHPIVTCYSCGYKSCFVHNMAWHKGRTCSDIDRDRAIAASDKRLLWGSAKERQEAASNEYLENATKPCPRCCCRVEKAGGCQHMRCWYCSYEYCWDCDANYDTIKLVGNCQHASTCPWHSDNLPNILGEYEGRDMAMVEENWSDHNPAPEPRRPVVEDSPPVAELTAQRPATRSNTETSDTDIHFQRAAERIMQGAAKTRVADALETGKTRKCDAAAFDEAADEGLEKETTKKRDAAALDEAAAEGLEKETTKKRNAAALDEYGNQARKKYRKGSNSKPDGNDDPCHQA